MKTLATLLFAIFLTISSAFAQEPATTTPEKKPQQFIIRLQLARPDAATGMTPDEQRLIGEHFQYLKKLTSERKVILAGRTTDDTRLWGIVILQVADEAEARHIMDNDPAIKGGVQKAELFPFVIALMAGSK
jgi:uncharacterized protein